MIKEINPTLFYSSRLSYFPFLTPHRMPFGFHRAEVIGALISVLLIWVVTAVLGEYIKPANQVEFLIYFSFSLHGSVENNQPWFRIKLWHYAHKQWGWNSCKYYVSMAENVGLVLYLSISKLAFQFFLFLQNGVLTPWSQSFWTRSQSFWWESYTLAQSFSRSFKS